MCVRKFESIKAGNMPAFFNIFRIASGSGQGMKFHLGSLGKFSVFTGPILDYQASDISVCLLQDRVDCVDAFFLPVER